MRRTIATVSILAMLAAIVPMTPRKDAVVHKANAAAVSAMTAAPNLGCDPANAPTVMTDDLGDYYLCDGGTGNYVIVGGHRVVGTGGGAADKLAKWGGTGVDLADSAFSDSSGAAALDASLFEMYHTGAGSHAFYMGVDSNHSLHVTRDSGTGVVTITTGSGSPTGSFTFGRNIFASNLSGTNTGDNPPSDTAYAGSWNGVTTTAPSKNAVYDQMELRQPLDAGLTSLAAFPTAADKLAYSTALDVWAETAITAHGRDLIDNAAAADSRATLSTAYALAFGAQISQSYGASSTFYLGTFSKTAGNSGVAALNKLFIQRAGVIRVAHVYTYSGTVTGTNENISAYVRLNNTTDTLIQAVGAATAERVFVNTAINITVAAGDYVEIKLVTPAWATAPTGTSLSGYLLVE